MTLQIQYPTARRSVQANSLDRLNKYILEKPIRGIPTQETSRQKTIRTSAQVAAVIIGGCGNLTFINITGKLAGDNEAYKWALVAGNTVAFGTITAWILLKMVNAQLRPRTVDELALIQSQTPRWLRNSIKTTAITAGLISQIPVAYIAYAYNNNNILYPIVILTSNASLPIHSLELTFDAFLRNRRYSEFERQLLQSKKALTQMIATVTQAVAAMTPQQRNQFLQELSTIASSSTFSEEDILMNYLVKLRATADGEPLTPDDPAWVTAVKYTAGATGLLLSFSLLSHYWMGGYEAAKLADEEDSAFHHFSAGFVTFCNTYLTADLIVKSTIGICSGVMNRVRGISKKTLSMELRPKLTNAFKVIAAASGALCYGASVQFSKDYFDGNFGRFIEVTSAMGNIAFVTSGMLDCVQEGVQEYFLHRGTAHEKRSFGFQNEMQRLASLIDQCSPVDFAKALLTWRALMPAEWNTSMNVPEKEALEAYIKSKESPAIETTRLLEIQEVV